MITEINKNQQPPRTILVAPLDWGLGHTTRCIPVIKQLLQKGYRVILAGEKNQENLLKTEFPDLEFLYLAGYNIRYGQTAFSTFFQLISQIPLIIYSIRRENKWLKKMIRLKDIDLVISDNRYGLYHKRIPSVFITHQLMIRQPFGKGAGNLLQYINYRFINRFSECWVPDTEGPNGLGGALSHPGKKPAIPLKYTGPLSRFSFTGKIKETNRLLIIISGPEPQRSIFENLVIQEIVTFNGYITVVRGLPHTDTFIPSTGMIQFYNHLPAPMLQEEIEKAGYIISRCGYSTVMDLARLQKKSILVPTPGQTEQEYLADYLSEAGFAYTIGQKNFRLRESLEAAEKFNYRPIPVQSEQLLAKAIDGLATLIPSRP